MKMSIVWLSLKETMSVKGIILNSQHMIEAGLLEATYVKS